MDNLENNLQADKPLIINEEINDYLLETSKWGKFLAIVGYVGMGLMVLIGLFVMIGFSAFSQMTDMDFPMGLLGLIYLVIAVIYYFPVTYLYRFSVQIRQGLSSKEQQPVTTGFENLKSIFKFMGIFTIVILSIYALILVIAVPAALIFAK